MSALLGLDGLEEPNALRNYGGEISVIFRVGHHGVVASMQKKRRNRTKKKRS